ncbi:acyltransferase [Clostridium botulinum]|nr:acyltransferase [Clostridium botulinum]
MLKTKRLKELDVLRALAFILVVEQHSMGGFANIKGISNFNYKIFSLFYVLGKPAVSIFICISGITLFYTYSKKINIKKYYIKRINNILIPYITWSIIYMLINKNTNDLVMQLFSGSGSYHLWYMGMIIRLLIYFPIILYLTKKLNKSNIIIKSIFFIALSISYYYLSKYQNIICSNVINFIFSNPTKYQERIINITPLFWYLYFIIGIYISFNYNKFKQIIIKNKFLIIICYILLLTYSYLNQIQVIKFNRMLSLSYYIFSFLALYVFSYEISNKIKAYKFFNFISKYSFSSYLSHILVVNNLVSIIPSQNILFYGFSLWIGTSIITPCIIKYISYFPYTKFITGVKTNPVPLLNKIKKTKQLNY